MNSVVVLSGWWDRTKGPLGEAAVNTVLGLVVVFAALIFISFIISLFKYVNKFEKANAANDEISRAVKETVSRIQAPDVQIDNFELVAIVTAAISEYEEAQGNTFKDGIVVRSIKRI